MRTIQTDFRAAARTAIELARLDGRERFVTPTAFGYMVTTFHMASLDCFWFTATNYGRWYAGSERGAAIRKSPRNYYN